MLKKLWNHLVAVPEGLDLFDKFYLRGLYVCCALMALFAIFFFISAFVGEMEIRHRLMIIAYSFLVMMSAYGLRLFIYWMHVKKTQLLQFIDRYFKAG